MWRGMEKSVLVRVREREREGKREGEGEGEGSTHLECIPLNYNHIKGRQIYE